GPAFVRELRVETVGRIAVAAGRAQRGAGDEEARAGDVAMRDRLFERDDDHRVGTDVAHGGETRHQGPARIADREIGVVEGGAGDGLGDRVAAVESRGDV